MLWKLYRGLMTPDPIWEEQAMYGGYKWIEFSETVWINRKWEIEFSKFLELTEISRGTQKIFTCNMSCLKLFTNVLESAGVLQRESSLSTDIFEEGLVRRYDDVLNVKPVPNIYKVLGRLQDFHELYVIGRNPKIDTFIKQYRARFSRIYTEEFFSVGEQKSIEELVKCSLYQPILVSEDSSKIKSMVRNWSNIVVI